MKLTKAKSPPRRARLAVSATLGFRGTTALVTLTPPADIAAVSLDGTPLAAADWRLSEDGTLRVACPSATFDTSAHTLRLDVPDADPVELSYCSCYRGEITGLDDDSVTGWLHDELRPTSALTLDVASGGAASFTVSNMPSAAPGGRTDLFAIRLPPRARAEEPELLAITISGTTHLPFGPILRGGTRSASIALAAAARRGFGASAAGLLFGSVLLPALLAALPEGAESGAIRLPGRLGLARRRPPSIDVIVPAECGEDADLASLLASGSTIAHRIVHHRHDIPLGPLLVTDADVVLLQPGAIVPPGLLDRLYRAAYADAAIATATPFSDKSAICRLPPLPLDSAALDALVREANAGLVRDIPAPDAGCLFIKRAALDDLGPRAVTDIARLAPPRGWRHVCAADTFVAFAGPRDPPDGDCSAEAERRDTLHDLRNRVVKTLWRRIGRIVLIVTLTQEGGAMRHVEDVMHRLAGEGFLVLALATAADHDGHAMVVIRRHGSDERLTYPQPAPIGEALADILDLTPMFIHIQHVLDLPDGVGEFVRDCGIPYAVTLHDFFYGCARVTLLDGGDAYCGMPPAAKCTACIRQAGVHARLHPGLAPFAQSGEGWRAKWGSLLRHAYQVIAPSRDTAERYAVLFPDVGVEVKPHFAPARTAPPKRVGTAGVGQKLRVAVPGALGRHKGAGDFIDLVRHCSRWEDDIAFVVIGQTDRDDDLEPYGNVALTGRYPAGTANDTLARSRCRVALFLSLFPETFSYALSEALEAGMVPVAYEFGAIGERLRSLGVGVLVPPRAPASDLVAALRRAATLQVSVPADAIWASYGSLFADYYAPALADLAAVAPPPDVPRVLAWPGGVARDGWCGAEIRLQIWSAVPLLRVALAFWVPAQGGLQSVEIAWTGAGENTVLAHGCLAANETSRVVCALPVAGQRMIDLVCRFDYLFALAPPDIREASAMFSGVEVSHGSGWRQAELPGLNA